MNQSDEHDELWHLLGKAKQPEASPFFARNVLRVIREVAQEKPFSLADWLSRHWQVASLGLSLASVAVVGAFQFGSHQPDPLVAIAEQVSESPDYLVITNLDELLASEESSVWLEKPVY